MCEGGPPSLSLGRLAELCRVIRMFEWAPSTLLTRFAEELRRALERGLLMSRIPGPDKGTGQAPTLPGGRDAPRVRGTRIRVDAEREGRLVIGD